MSDSGSVRSSESSPGRASRAGRRQQQPVCPSVRRDAFRAAGAGQWEQSSSAGVILPRNQALSASL